MVRRLDKAVTSEHITYAVDLGGGETTDSPRDGVPTQLEAYPFSGSTAPLDRESDDLGLGFAEAAVPR